MSKPATAPEKIPAKLPEVPKYRPGIPAKRIRAIQVASGSYTVIEETYDCPPTSVKVLKEKSSRIGAEDRVRLYLEDALGFNRFGDSGL